ncbi:MAG: hypothetical protein Q9160_001907 [Pyrenula sp. 1 TL-2023]
MIRLCKPSATVYRDFGQAGALSPRDHDDGEYKSQNPRHVVKLSKRLDALHSLNETHSICLIFVREDINQYRDNGIGSFVRAWGGDIAQWPPCRMREAGEICAVQQAALHREAAARLKKGADVHASKSDDFDGEIAGLKRLYERVQEERDEAEELAKSCRYEKQVMESTVKRVREVAEDQVEAETNRRVKKAKARYENQCTVQLFMAMMQTRRDVVKWTLKWTNVQLSALAELWTDKITLFQHSYRWRQSATIISHHWGTEWG